MKKEEFLKLLYARLVERGVDKATAEKETSHVRTYLTESGMEELNVSLDEMADGIISMIEAVVERAVDTHMNDDQPATEWDLDTFSETLRAVIPVGKVNIKEDSIKTMTKDKLKNSMKILGKQMYEFKEKEIGMGQAEGEERMRELERMVLLRVIDQKWMDHIDDMDRMRQGIGLHAYAQRDPLVEYKFAAYDMFDEMSAHIQEDTLKMLYRVQIQTRVQPKPVQRQMFTNKDDSLVKQPKKREEDKVGRNDMCPCGSGKKYKQCCGREV